MTFSKKINYIHDYIDVMIFKDFQSLISKTLNFVKIFNPCTESAIQFSFQNWNRKGHFFSFQF